VNCIIIGAAGFIGRYLGHAHHQRGDAVLGMDIEHTVSEREVPYSIEVCDLTASSVTIPSDTDVVYYLAQSPYFRQFPAHGDHLFAVNTAGALCAAEAATKAGVNTFIYASSGTVYAPTFEPMSESQPTRRDQAYALSKVCAEDALALIGGSMNVLCPRFFGVFGPNQQKGTLVQAITNRIRQGDPVTIEGNPEESEDINGLRMSFTFVEDLVHSLIDLVDVMASGRNLNGPINVAGSEPISIRRLAKEISSVIDIVPIFELADRCRESDYIADISRLRSVIDPTFTELSESIRRTLATDE